MKQSHPQPPLVAHIVHRFDIGGLENGIVNLINQTDELRHVVISLTESSALEERIHRADVTVHSLGKRPGQDPAMHWRLFRLLRQIRPDITHTRNVGTIECQLTAALAGVRTRIHGEHGWDTYDPDGTNLRYKRLRRLVSHFLSRFVVLSLELERWLVDRVGIPAAKVIRICNGVDTSRIQPMCRVAPAGGRGLVIGTVTRLSEIKDPLNTLDAFFRLADRVDAQGPQPKLIVVGDGPLMEAVEQRVRQSDHAALVRLVGAQADVVPWLQEFDLFVLGSRREGISNTILEAMAAGLPVVATDTGGNPELVLPDETGLLVPPGSPDALAEALLFYQENPNMLHKHGQASRLRAETEYALSTMVARYVSLYENALAGNPA